MNKDLWPAGTMVFPAPVVMASCGDINGSSNIITIAWTGNICSDPPMTYISVRPHRHSHEIIKKSKEFVINLATKKLVYATDFCGVKSGRDTDKFKAMKLTKEKAKFVKAPLIKECPINIECEVTEIKSLGTHDMFIAKVLCIHADNQYKDKKGAFDLKKADPICYAHGKYYTLGAELGYYGYSVNKKKRKK